MKSKLIIHTFTFLTLVPRAARMAANCASVSVCIVTGSLFSSTVGCLVLFQFRTWQRRRVFPSTLTSNNSKLATTPQMKATHLWIFLSLFCMLSLTTVGGSFPSTTLILLVAATALPAVASS